MADLFAAKDAAGATVQILTDQVADGTFGTGQKQIVGIMDATPNSTNKLVVDASGRIVANPTFASANANTSVAAATGNTSILASNAARIGATIFNDSTAAMYVLLGAAASTTAFNVKLAAAGYYEVPFGYTGAIHAVWDSATGNARVNELT